MIEPIIQFPPQLPTNGQLIDELKILRVDFLQGNHAMTNHSPIAPEILLVSLAMNHEARMRLALIPLLLCHPELAAYVKSAAQQLPALAQLVLKCYYTAAQLLQQKYRERLNVQLGRYTLLPDLFTNELGLPKLDDPQAALQALAQRHRALSGQPINWLGTYEHALERFLLHQERKSRWNI